MRKNREGTLPVWIEIEIATCKIHLIEPHPLSKWRYPRIVSCHPYPDPARIVPLKQIMQSGIVGAGFALTQYLGIWHAPRP